MYKRYEFIKRIYKKYIIILEKKNRYISYGIDKEILEYIGFIGDIDKIREYEINYIIVDNLDIVKQDEFQVNKYNKYKYICKLIKILEK